MSMKLKYNLENIGNIDKASIIIKPLTIIAGENSSGKTFVTKSLYTLLDSIYKNHFLDALITNFKKLKRSFLEFKNISLKLSKKDLEFQDYFNKYLEEIQFFIIEIKECEFEKQDLLIPIYREKFDKFDNKIESYLKDKLHTKEILNNNKEFINIIKNRFEIVVEGISSSLDIGFKKNFQITNLLDIINKNQLKNLKLSLDNFGEVEIDKHQKMEFNFTSDCINQIQSIENIIFFDSPVYIKIRKALEKNKNTLSFLFDNENDKYLKGYPQYLDKLYNFIDKEYIDIADFNLISQEIQEIIKGKLEVTNSGDINYKDEYNNTIPLSLTAMGISNIGLIDLLIRNNIINKGSFLIMDEPEVHLHPEWQVIMAQLLYKIAKSGANIIIATHSLDFLKAFENILKKEEEKAQEIISINKMPYKKNFLELSELEKVGIVLDDLSKPFYDLYMQDI